MFRPKPTNFSRKALRARILANAQLSADAIMPDRYRVWNVAAAECCCVTCFFSKMRGSANQVLYRLPREIQVYRSARSSRETTPHTFA